MRFMVIVKASKDSEEGKMPSEELLAAMAKFNEDMVKAGILLDAAGLQPSSKGARIRFSGNKRTVIDGPHCRSYQAPFVVMWSGTFIPQARGTSCVSWQ
jgi:hypothetical protein